MTVIVTTQAPDFPQKQQRLLYKLVCGEGLDRREAGELFHIILTGAATPAQIAAALTAFAVQGETAEALAGAAEAMLSKSIPFPAPSECADLCGTGGDNAGTLNVSTAAAFVAAGAGLAIAKHGNRAVSSSSGSQDVLSALNVNVSAPAAVQAKALEKAGVCFLSAPLFHPAMRHVSPVRQELRFRTIFNLLGPLVNPARPSYRLNGVYSREKLRPVTSALRVLGVKRALTVCSEEGWDEVSPCGKTFAIELREDGATRERTFTPAEFGLAPADPEELRGGTPQENARELRLMLQNKGRPAYRAAALINAGCALYVAGKAQDPRSGYLLAEHALKQGKAEKALDLLQAITSA